MFRTDGLAASRFSSAELTWTSRLQFTLLVLLLLPYPNDSSEFLKAAEAPPPPRLIPPPFNHSAQRGRPLCPRIPIPGSVLTDERMAVNPAAASYHPKHGWVAMLKLIMCFCASLCSSNCTEQLMDPHPVLMSLGMDPGYIDVSHSNDSAVVWEYERETYRPMLEKAGGAVAFVAADFRPLWHGDELLVAHWVKMFYPEGRRPASECLFYAGHSCEYSVISRMNFTTKRMQLVHFFHRAPPSAVQLAHPQQVNLSVPRPHKTPPVPLWERLKLKFSTPPPGREKNWGFMSSYALPRGLMRTVTESFINITLGQASSGAQPSGAQPSGEGAATATAGASSWSSAPEEGMSSGAASHSSSSILAFYSLFPCTKVFEFKPGRWETSKTQSTGITFSLWSSWFGMRVQQQREERSPLLASHCYDMSAAPDSIPHALAFHNSGHPQVWDLSGSLGLKISWEKRPGSRKMYSSGVKAHPAGRGRGGTQSGKSGGSKRGKSGPNGGLHSGTKVRNSTTSGNTTTLNGVVLLGMFHYVQKSPWVSKQHTRSYKYWLAIIDPVSFQVIALSRNSVLSRDFCWIHGPMPNVIFVGSYHILTKQRQQQQAQGSVPPQGSTSLTSPRQDTAAKVVLLEKPHNISSAGSWAGGGGDAGFNQTHPGWALRLMFGEGDKHVSYGDLDLDKVQWVGIRTLTPLSRRSRAMRYW